MRDFTKGIKPSSDGTDHKQDMSSNIDELTSQDAGLAGPTPEASLNVVPQGRKAQAEQPSVSKTDLCGMGLQRSNSECLVSQPAQFNLDSGDRTLPRLHFNAKKNASSNMTNSPVLKQALQSSPSVHQ